MLNRPAFTVIAGVLAAAVSGCALEAPEVASSSNTVVSSNGMVLNGMVLNGMVLNGVTLNSLALNGMVLNGITLNGAPLTAGEQDAFKELYSYLVGCALDESQSVVLIDDGTPITYYGALGLAPGWFEKGIGVHAQERVSGCLMARTNALGQSVQISVRGQDYEEPSHHELAAYSQLEGHFWGNLFLQHPVAEVCTEEGYVGENGRVCTVPVDKGEGGAVSACGFTVVGVCSEVCYDLHPSGLYWQGCSNKGHTAKHGTTVWQL